MLEGEHVVDLSANDHEEEEAEAEEEDMDCDTVTEMEPVVVPKPWNHFKWLQLDTSIRLNLAGIGTDWSPIIEIEMVPSGRRFHYGIASKTDDKSGRTVHDQKLFSLLNSRNQTLLSIDFSDDLKSFHVMEPDSDRFIAFFTLPSFPQEENAAQCAIEIHNVIDEEIYVVDSLRVTDLSIPIKSVSGEELAVIMRSPPKWTASQPGLMTLHFSGDDREGLTCRERAVILGFFLSIGIQGMSHWKRSSVGILTVYVFFAIIGCIIVLWVYIAFRNDYSSLSGHNSNATIKQQLERSSKYLFPPSPASS